MLRPYQRDGVAWLQHLREHDAGGVLADDMGLGKTLQTIAHVAIEQRARAARPAGADRHADALVGNWRASSRGSRRTCAPLALHGPDRRALRRGSPRHRRRGHDLPARARDATTLAAHPRHLVVLDEAHAIKNPRAKAADAVRALDARHRVRLTGTPIENHLGELWSLSTSSIPGLLGGRDEFARQFRIPIEQRGESQRLAALRERVRPFILRRTKERSRPSCRRRRARARVELTARSASSTRASASRMHERVPPASSSAAWRAATSPCSTRC